MSKLPVISGRKCVQTLAEASLETLIAILNLLPINRSNVNILLYNASKTYAVIQGSEEEYIEKRIIDRMKCTEVTSERQVLEIRGYSGSFSERGG